MTKKILILTVITILLLPTSALAEIVTLNATIKSLAEELIKIYGLAFFFIILIISIFSTLLMNAGKKIMDFLCQKKISSFQNKYNTELEELKKAHVKEIETYKGELAKELENQKKQNNKELEEYRNNLIKEIERAKSYNEKSCYISKTQFDAEFRMYQEISESMFEMVLDATNLYKFMDIGTDNSESGRIQKHQKAQKSLFLYQNNIFKYAAFINEKIFFRFEELRKLAHQQVSLYLLDIKPEHDSQHEVAGIERSEKLQELHDKITKQLREYLASLKVE